MPTYHSATGQTAYQDLLRLLRDDAAAGVTGTPTLRQLRGRGYWYDRYRLGEKDVERYIGEDTPALRDRLARIGALRDDMAAREKERARLVRLLRAEGYLAPDVTSGQILFAMARTGVFRLGGTLVGTHAFRCYEAELGVRIGADRAAMTDDIDIASFERLSLALGDTLGEPMEKVLGQFDFAPVPGIGNEGIWKWRQTRRNTLVEFLTPSFDDEEGIRPLPALGVSARALHHLNYLIAAPLAAAVLYRSGVLVQVPRPERFAIHKLIVADRRREGPDALKSRKDRMQAEFLIGVLAEDRPADLAEAWQDALSRGPAWRARIEASLARMPGTRVRLAGLS